MDLNYCFVISSCIYINPMNNYSRSIFDPQKRIEQTLETIASIKRNAKDAYIVFVDNGIKDPCAFFEDKVDRYVYCGNKKKVRKAADGKNKGLGEIYSMKEILCYLTQFDYFFKISGRYKLDSAFDLDMYFKKKGFAAYHLTRKYSDIKNLSYVWGSYSTDLYGLNVCYLRRYTWSLLLSEIVLRRFQYSLELVLPFMMNILCIPFNNLVFEACSGFVANNGQLLVHDEIK